MTVALDNPNDIPHSFAM